MTQNPLSHLNSTVDIAQFLKTNISYEVTFMWGRKFIYKDQQYSYNEWISFVLERIQQIGDTSGVGCKDIIYSFNIHDRKAEIILQECSLPTRLFTYIKRISNYFFPREESLKAIAEIHLSSFRNDLKIPEFIRNKSNFIKYCYSEYMSSPILDPKKYLSFPITEGQCDQLITKNTTIEEFNRIRENNSNVHLVSFLSLVAFKGNYKLLEYLLSVEKPFKNRRDNYMYLHERKVLHELSRYTLCNENTRLAYLSFKALHDTYPKMKKNSIFALASNIRNIALVQYFLFKGAKIKHCINSDYTVFNRRGIDYSVAACNRTFAYISTTCIVKEALELLARKFQQYQLLLGIFENNFIPTELTQIVSSILVDPLNDL